MKHILDLTPQDLEKFLADHGEKPFRLKQLKHWLFEKNTDDFSRMSSLSDALKKSLAEAFECHYPAIERERISEDGTRKYLLKLSDGAHIEMVLIPAGKKNTLCISSQVGCSRECAFCATAKLGLHRNLLPSEIVGQVLLAMRLLGEETLTNLVFMGMGEPLDNYDNVVRAVRILQEDVGFSPRRMTISTCGVVPGIRKLSASGLKIKLAVSLNSAIPYKRDRLMPINRIYSLTELKRVLLDFRRKSAYRITFEYIMFGDYNTGEEDAKALRTFAGDISCKINLLPFHPVAGSDFSPPTDEEIANFQKSLYELSAAVTLRESRGKDIEAACGQLAGDGRKRGKELHKD